MKKLTLIFLILFSLKSFAQENEKKDFRKFSIGASFSPDYCFRVLKINDASFSSDMVIEFRNENESAKFGYTTGLNLFYSISEHFGLETGIQFSNKGYQTKKDQLYFYNQFDGTGFSSDLNSGPKFKIVYDDYYFDIPMKVNFIIGKNKIRLVTSGGIVANIFYKETSAIHFDSGKKTNATSDKYNLIDISPMASVGISCKIGKRMNVIAAPTIRYGILKIADTPVTGYLWNAGFNISYYYQL